MAKEIPGLLLHFTQQIINVQWDDGLAVEFYAQGAGEEAPTA